MDCQIMRTCVEQLVIDHQTYAVPRIETIWVLLPAKFAEKGKLIAIKYEGWEKWVGGWEVMEVCKVSRRPEVMEEECQEPQSSAKDQTHIEKN